MFLHNSTITWPPIARYAQNYYYANTRLFIVGWGEIQSMNNTTQGDPTAMTIYAIAIISLILMLVAEAIQIDKAALKK